MLGVPLRKVVAGVGVVLLACTPTSAPGPTLRARPLVTAPVAARPPSVTPSPSVLADDADEAARPRVIPPDPDDQVDFDPSALSFGGCHEYASTGAGVEHPSGPIIIGSEVAAWDEGAPLWVMTNAGGVVRAAVGRHLESCGFVIADEPPDGGDDEGVPCVPAVGIVTASPLRCESMIPGPLPEHISGGDGSIPLPYLLAFPRRYRPPATVRMRFDVRVHAVCQHVGMDYDEPGALFEVASPAASIDRHLAAAISGLRRLSWRHLRVVYLESELSPHHVIQAVEHEPRVRRAQWAVLGDDDPWKDRVAAEDRHWPDTYMNREPDCGLPVGTPVPALSFMHEGSLHWLTVEDRGDLIAARLWRVGPRLRRIRSFPSALDRPRN